MAVRQGRIPFPQQAAAAQPTRFVITGPATAGALARFPDLAGARQPDVVV